MRMLRAADSRGTRQRDGQWFRPAILLVVLALLGAAGAMAASRLAPAKGRLLIAARSLADPNFSRSVVLLLEYSQDGAVGVIVNRPAGVPPSALLPDLSALSRYEGCVYLGGPVAIDMLVLLVRDCDAFDDAQPVFEDVCYGGSAEAARRGDSRGATASRVRMYVGHAGWGAGQLDAEIARGDWHIVEARDERVFIEDPHALWERLVPRRSPLETRSRRRRPCRRSRWLPAVIGRVAALRVGCELLSFRVDREDLAVRIVVLRAAADDVAVALKVVASAAGTASVYQPCSVVGEPSSS